MTEPLHRYLIPFDTRRLPRIRTDVLVVGSGVAGLRLALEAADVAPGGRASVLLATKGALTDSSSDWAQGGIAAPVGPRDCVEAHVTDTLGTGEGLCDVDVVRAVIGGAQGAIDELVEWGASFDRDSDGEVSLTTEGGHGAARVLHARGDSTGAELVATLVSEAERCPRLRLLEHAFIVDLLTDESGACRGALLFTRHGEFQLVEASVTALASGGLGRLFRETTNPPVATGDGVAMGYRAGAVVSDLELVQFHPTTFYVAGAPRTLISEAVRGEGATLRNAVGERFMPDVHPAAELAPRDIVSRASLEQMRRHDMAYVQLDLRHLDAERVLARFPRLARLCRTFHIDIATEMIPVRPSAHYAIGGIEAALDGTTSVPRLLVCGEAAATGLHGANRLASNSLLEGLVCGARAGRRALELVGSPPAEPIELAWDVPSEVGGGAIDMDDLEQSLKSLMWRQVGVVRSGEGLSAALRQLEFWGRYIWQRTFFHPRGWALQNMLTAGWLMTRLALAREESRGVHWREDCPERWPEGQHSRVGGGRPIDWRMARAAEQESEQESTV